MSYIKVPSKKDFKRVKQSKTKEAKTSREDRSPQPSLKALLTPEKKAHLQAEFAGKLHIT